MVDSIHVMHHEEKHYLLFRSLRILEGACNVVFVFMIFVLGLYFLGNYQEFLDTSQDMLLNVLKTVSVLSALVSLYYLVALVLWAIRQGRVLVLRILFAVVSLGLSGFLTFGANLVLVVLAPVTGGAGK